MTFIFNSLRKSKSAPARGFTLVELIISVAIVAILSVALYVQQGKFDSAIFIKNTAQEVALTIREAQSYSRGVISDGSGEGSYAVYFDRRNNPNNPDDKRNQQIIFFEDNGVRGQYEPGGSDEIIRTYSLINSIEVDSFEFIPPGSGDPISNSDCVVISFKRPNPEPLYGLCTGGIRTSGTLRIFLNSRTEEGVQNVISVSSTGQIQVE